MAEESVQQVPSDPLSAAAASESEEEKLQVDYVETRIKKILQLYSDGKIIQAEKKIRRLESAVKKRGAGDPKLVELMDKHKETFQFCLIEAREIRVLLKEFSIDEGWDRIETDGAGGRTSFKSNPGTSIQTLRIDAEMDTSFFNVLAVLMEVDMFHHWVPCTMGLGLLSCMEVASLSKLRKIGYFTSGLPWPISDRDICVYGYGADLLDVQGSVLAVLRSPDVKPVLESAHVLAADHSIAASKKKKEKEKKKGQSSSTEPQSDEASNTVALSLEEILDAETKAKLPPQHKKFVRVEMRIGGFLLTPLSKDKTKVSLLWMVDPRLDLIPSALVNWGLKHVALYAVSLLKQHAKAIDTDVQSPYIARMAQKPEVYEFLRKRFETWLEENQKVPGDEAKSSKDTK